MNHLAGADELERVVALVTARASNAASNEDVEQAIANMLGRPIEEDTEDYDDNDEEDRKPAAVVAAPPPTKRKRGRPRTKVDYSKYEDIPFGKQGAQMMTVFGDVRQPCPDVVQAVLTATRRLLQVAIQQARQVRRKSVRIYAAIRQSHTAYKPKLPKLQSEWSTDMLWRAHSGYDGLASSPKCGFDVQDLRILFPAQMNAYQRWNETYAEAAAKNKKEAATPDDEGEEEEEEEVVEGVDGGAEKEASTAVAPEPATSSNDNNEDDPETITTTATNDHLQGRLANFDVRTNAMKSDWYLQFSDLRQGSFLPRRNATSTTDKSSTSNSNTSWPGLSTVRVRFLHWIGFDPTSALPPPCGETVEALGFLAYDFFGQIVEKAIAGRGTKKDSSSEEEQQPLTQQDIQAALQHPDLCPKSSSLGPQLYFGPGFEDRLEMELEEMLRDEEVDEEEAAIRQEEAEFFAKLAAEQEATERTKTTTSNKKSSVAKKPRKTK